MEKCPHCGSETSAGARSCPSCKSDLAAATPTDEPGYHKISRTAIASLVLGVLGLLLIAMPALEIYPPPLGWPRTILADLYILFILAPVPILALTLGLLSSSRIRRSAGRKKGRAIAVAGRMLGYLGVGLIAFYSAVGTWIYKNLAGPDYPTCEDSAVGSIRVLEIALITYASTYDKGFPLTLSVLGPPASGTAQSADAADLIDAKLAEGMRWRYSFTYRPGKKEKDGRIRTFTIQGDPIRVDANCRTHYFTDETGVIRHDRYRPATQHSPPIIY